MKKLMQKILEAFKPKPAKTLGEMELKAKEKSFEEKAEIKRIGLKARLFQKRHPELQGKAEFDAGTVVSSRFVSGTQSFPASFVETEKKTAGKSNLRVVHEGGVTYRAINVSQAAKDQVKQTLQRQNEMEQKRIESLKQSGSVALPLSMARIEKITEEARNYAQNYKGIKVSEASMEIIEISPSGKVADISVFGKHDARPNATRPVRPVRVTMR